LKDVIFQGLKRWMRGQDLTDGMPVFQHLFKLATPS